MSFSLPTHKTFYYFPSAQLAFALLLLKDIDTQNKQQCETENEALRQKFVFPFFIFFTLLNFIFIIFYHLHQHHHLHEYTKNSTLNCCASVSFADPKMMWCTKWWHDSFLFYVCELNDISISRFKTEHQKRNKTISISISFNNMIFLPFFFLIRWILSFIFCWGSEGKRK